MSAPQTVSERLTQLENEIIELRKIVLELCQIIKKDNKDEE